MTVTTTIEARNPVKNGAVRIEQPIRLDRRTRQWRRLRQLADSYAQALGGWASLSEVKRAEIEQAAALVVISEQASERHMRGEPVPLDDVVRAARVSSLAVKRLNIQREAPKAPSLAEYLAAKRAREAAT